MAKKDIIRTGQINSLYFVKLPFRSDLNFFSIQRMTNAANEMRKEINLPYSYIPEIYEVQFFMKKPIFKKYTLAQLKKLNLR